MKVLIPRTYLRWLDVEYGALESRLGDEGFHSVCWEDSLGARMERASAESELPRVLDDAVRYAVCVTAESLESDVEGQFSALAAVWSSRIYQYFRAAARCLQEHRPDLVVIVQGYEPANAAVRAAALGLDIPVLAVENTALSDRMIWDNLSGVTTNRNLGKKLLLEV